MNLLAARVVLRQRSLADTLDLAMPFCLANKRPLGVLALVMLGPLAALLAYLRIARHWGWPSLWLLCAAPRRCRRGRVHGRAGRAAVQSRRRRRACGGFVARFFRRLPASLFAIVVRESCWCVCSADRDPFFLAPPTIFMPEAMLLEGATFGQGAGAQPRAGAQPDWRLLRDLAGEADTPRVRRDRDGRHRATPCVGFVLQLGHPTGELFDDGGSGFAVLGALLAVPLAAGDALPRLRRPAHAQGGLGHPAPVRRARRAERPRAEGARRDAAPLLMLRARRDGDRRRRRPAGRHPRRRPRRRAAAPTEAFAAQGRPAAGEGRCSRRTSLLHQSRATR